MMQRSTIVYAVLFVVAMIGAYVSWTHEPATEADGGVVLIDAKPEQMASIRYETKELDATLEIKEDELGRYLWVTTERRVEKVKPPSPRDPHDPHGSQDGVDPHAPDTGEAHKGADAGTDAGEAPKVADAEEPPKPEPTVETTTETAAFKAGKAGDQLLEDLAPFRVSRALEVTEADLTEFGFDDPKGKLVLTTKSGKERKFDVGETAYGHRNVYIRDTDDGTVYVMKRSIVNPLDRADTRLPEKELFEGPVADIARVAITTAQNSLEAVQRNRDDASKATWTAPDSEEANQSVDSWLDKVFRLRASEYASVTAKPQLESAFAVKLYFEKDEPVTIEVMRGAAADGEPDWYARSGYTRGLVKLNGNLASDAAADVATLFAGDEAAE